MLSRFRKPFASARVLANPMATLPTIFSLEEFTHFCAYIFISPTHLFFCAAQLSSSNSVNHYLPLKSIESLRLFIGDSMVHRTESEFEKAFSVFALPRDAPQGRKVKSFSNDGKLSKEGLFLNGIMTDFDHRKDEQVVDELLKIARGPRAARLLEKSGMGKTYTWYRMCSRQDSEVSSRTKVFVLLLSVPRDSRDSSKMDQIHCDLSSISTMAQRMRHPSAKRTG